MKSEREIRSHIADLTRAAAGPCRHEHRDAGEAARCEYGKTLMLHAVRMLAWVLGEEPGYDRMVESVAADVRRGP